MLGVFPCAPTAHNAILTSVLSALVKISLAGVAGRDIGE